MYTKRLVLLFKNYLFILWLHANYIQHDWKAMTIKLSPNMQQVLVLSLPWLSKCSGSGTNTHATYGLLIMRALQAGSSYM